MKERVVEKRVRDVVVWCWRLRLVLECWWFEVVGCGWFVLCFLLGCGWFEWLSVVLVFLGSCWLFRCWRYLLLGYIRFGSYCGGCWGCGLFICLFGWDMNGRWGLYGVWGWCCCVWFCVDCVWFRRCVCFVRIFWLLCVECCVWVFDVCWWELFWVSCECGRVCRVCECVLWRVCCVVGFGFWCWVWICWLLVLWWCWWGWFEWVFFCCFCVGLIWCSFGLLNWWWCRWCWERRL